MDHILLTSLKYSPFKNLGYKKVKSQTLNLEKNGLIVYNLLSFKK